MLLILGEVSLILYDLSNVNIKGVILKFLIFLELIFTSLFELRISNLKRIILNKYY